MDIRVKLELISERLDKIEDNNKRIDDLETVNAEKLDLMRLYNNVSELQRNIARAKISNRIDKNIGSVEHKKFRELENLLFDCGSLLCDRLQPKSSSQLLEANTVKITDNNNFLGINGDKI